MKKSKIRITTVAKIAEEAELKGNQTMFEDKNCVIYVRGNGFLTEAGEWSYDVVDARLFTEDCATLKRESLIDVTDKAYNPVIFKWL